MVSVFRDSGLGFQGECCIRIRPEGLGFGAESLRFRDQGFCGD